MFLTSRLHGFFEIELEGSNSLMENNYSLSERLQIWHKEQFGVVEKKKKRLWGRACRDPNDHFPAGKCTPSET